jgi:hypothetical protein
MLLFLYSCSSFVPPIVKKDIKKSEIFEKSIDEIYLQVNSYFENNNSVYLKSKEKNENNGSFIGDYILKNKDEIYCDCGYLKKYINPNISIFKSYGATASFRILIEKLDENKTKVTSKVVYITKNKYIDTCQSTGYFETEFLKYLSKINNQNQINDSNDLKKKEENNLIQKNKQNKDNSSVVSFLYSYHPFIKDEKKFEVKKNTQVSILQYHYTLEIMKFLVELGGLEGNDVKSKKLIFESSIWGLGHLFKLDNYAYISIVLGRYEVEYFDYPYKNSSGLSLSLGLLCKINPLVLGINYHSVYGIGISAGLTF